MPSDNTPLESLTAFAIVFAVGALSVIGLGMYVGKIKRDATRTTPPI